MTLVPGSRLGPYEIVAPLGAGGMGEVYRARDSRLGREVAVKVLPAEVASDPDRLRRFEQEARTASALQHPNLLVVFDVGTDDERAYLVTELLYGRSLRELLASGERIPARRVVEWGAQAARGLAAAHEKGIVHRDLKPENLFLTAESTIKILDFGLAKLTALDEGALAAAPTIAGTDTASGVILGTTGYMAPEQVRGEKVDARADIFALGCVLYELLGGRRAFQGESAIDTLHAILREEPTPLAELRADVPAAVARVVDACLAKSPALRFQSARDLALSLEALAVSSGVATTASRAATLPIARASARPGWLLAAAAGALALAVGFFAGSRSSRSEAATPVRVRTLTYSGHDFTPAASPDGKTLAFSSDRDGRARIWIRKLATGGEAPITEGPDRQPRFFPDGESLLFARAEGDRSALYRVQIVGGQPRKLIDDADTADVSPDGSRIAFSRVVVENGKQHSSIGLARADGGDVRVLLRGDDLEGLFQPRFSPDGRLVAVVWGGQAGAQGEIRVVSVDTQQVRSIRAPLPNAVLSSVVWSADGRAVYFVQANTSLGGVVNTEGRLYRHELDSGETTFLAWTPATANTLCAAGPGRLVYDGALPRANLRAIDLGTGSEGEPGHWLTRGSVVDRQPVVSPDGERVLFSSNRNGNLDIWSLSFATGAAAPLTDDPAEDWDPGFTRDGRSLLWSSNRSGTYEIWIADADGSDPRQLTHDGDAENPTATPDGAWIVYASGAQANAGIWKIRPDGSDATLLTKGLLLNPELSPDGEHVVYRRAFTGAPRGQVRVLRTADGSPVPFAIEIKDFGFGHSGRARWLGDGREIAFIGTDERDLQGVFAQQFVPGRDTSATRRRLGGFDDESLAESFGLSRDGQRLVVATLEQTANLMTIENVPGLEDATAPPR